MPKMRCRKCSETFPVDRALFGQQTTCPHCGAANRVPQPKQALPADSAKKPAQAEPPIPGVSQAKIPPEPSLAGDSGGEGSPPASEGLPVVRVAAPTPGRKSRRPASRRRSSGPLLLIGSAAAAVLVVAALGVHLTRSDPTPPSAAPATARTAVDKAGLAAARDAVEDQSPAVANAAAAPLRIEPVPDATVAAGEVLLIAIDATADVGSDQPLRFSLGPGSPPGARVDPQTGSVSWRPDDADAGKRFPFAVSVTAGQGRSAEVAFEVAVLPADNPLAQLVQSLQARGLSVEDGGDQVDPLLGRAARLLTVDGREVLVAEYRDASEADALVALAEQRRDDLTAAFAASGEGLKMYRGDRLVARFGGDPGSLAEHLRETLGEPFVDIESTRIASAAGQHMVGPLGAAVGEVLPDGAAPDGSDVAASAPAGPEFVAPGQADSALGTGAGGLPEFASGGFTDADVEQLLELYDNRMLFSVKEYPGLRRLFADRFERSHATEMDAAWGDDAEKFKAWLEANRPLKEELFLAIAPEVDDVVAALRIFKELKDRFPEQVLPYGNLAIAIAVTWDQPRAIYDYGGHQRRAKAVLPENLVGAAENFAYFLDNEQFMQGRGQWLPWEFLVHVVDHRTPADERQWSLRNYLAGRAMIGKCYQDVPYDHLMLETGSAQARLNNQPYTLENLRAYGGVCAMQADFASRVAKNLGVPAAYVGGESAYGDLHAWVMWVELQTVTPKSIVFSLQSHGRYRGDKYYVGTLTDPRSGHEMTDRQLELRLHTVGLDPIAKRQADLVMAAYPTVKAKRSLAVNDQFAYMSRIVQLCPGNEQAWIGLAGMASNETVKEKHRKQMAGILNQLFDTFANFPDFTWTIFDSLISFEDRLKERIKLYERLVLAYQAAQRPDLASQARLRLTDLLIEDGRQLEAVDGLAITVYAFADEGRYVPTMLDRIEAICQELDGATPHLLRFYHSFLPKIPQMRGDRPSKYCMQMFERGIALFRQHGDLTAAQGYAMQLAEIEAGRGRRS